VIAFGSRQKENTLIQPRLDQGVWCKDELLRQQTQILNEL